MSNKSLYDTAQKITTAQLTKFGTTVVVAPHQDDESLGCGGTIALLKQLGLNVHVVFVSDGSMSHPNSKLYPTQKLVALRKSEAIAALAFLDVPVNDITFLDLQDGQVPHQNSAGFGNAVNAAKNIIKQIKPQTVLLPWRRDPHKDHRAAWQIINKAIKTSGSDCKKLEYFIWLWERAESADLPEPGEGTIFSVDISPVKDLKRKAIAAHISQTTRLIDDDPEGFILSAEVLDHFSGSVELFIEV